LIPFQVVNPRSREIPEDTCPIPLKAASWAIRLGVALAFSCWVGMVAFCAPGDTGVNPDIAMGSTSSFEILTNGLGSWIWAAHTYDRQTCQLWRSFEIPANARVKSALVRMTADNEHTLFLDGRELGRSAEWRNLCQYDLTMLMNPGRHVLAVMAFNATDYAGVIFGMHVDFQDGRELAVKSDVSWRIVPEGVRGWEKMTEAPDSWPPATIVAALGDKPWWQTPDNVEYIPAAVPIATPFWQTKRFQLAMITMFGLGMLVSLALMGQLALHRQERWLLQQERARIARDIHDDLGSRMTQLVLHGEVAQSELPAESETRFQLQGICDEARGLLSSVDEILWAVNPQRDTLRDFTSYVCGYAHDFFKYTPIQCLFDVDPEMSPAPLDLPVRRSLLMAFKEALNNCLKHSEASTVKIEIRWQHQKLVVVVKDNGKGFAAGTARSDRNGLSNMSRRLAELGGACLVSSKPGQGCRVEFSVPLSQWRRRGLDWLWKPKTFAGAAGEARHRRTNNLI